MSQQFALKPALQLGPRPPHWLVEREKVSIEQPATSHPSSQFQYLRLSLLAFRCNFESGYCGLKQTRGDTFNWGRRQGRTPTQGTGPVNDHTSGVGMYTKIYLLLVTNALSPHFTTKNIRAFLKANFLVAQDITLTWNHRRQEKKEIRLC